jgi:pimeloyl-ACP methyl ester carboxylesterase
MIARPVHRGIRTALALLVAAALLVTAAPIANAGERGRSDHDTRRHHRETIRWQPCYAEEELDFECAVLKVPLDHDRPQGRTIDLAVVRLPATDPGRHTRSLFLNPGGPGGSGVDFVVGFGPFADEVLGPDVRARYDLIGVDPRGILRSTPLRCFGTEEEALTGLPPTAFPLTRAEVGQFIRADRTLARACGRNAGPIARHMSTANVARDFDLLRRRLGDRKLNFLGLSYGSFLGATYANLFPRRVGAMVIDGVLDPIRWVNRRAHVPFSTRLRSDEGAQETLERFFELCEEAGPDLCAIAPDAAGRYAELADRLRDEPVAIVDPESGEQVPITYQDLIAITLGALYDPFAFPFLADLVALIEAGGTPQELGAALRALDNASGVVDNDDVPAPHDDAFPEVPEYDNFVEDFPGVVCTDTDNPRSYRSWVRAGARADARFGYFGRLWTWASSPCALWPFRDRDRYAGPWRTSTATPVLVIGNLYDPATRYEGAVRVRELLSNSALLTVDVPGHTSLGLSGCAGAVTGAYLVDPDGTASSVDGEVCPQEFNPFELVAPMEQTEEGLEPQLRLEIMPEVAYRPRS